MNIPIIDSVIGFINKGLDKIVPDAGERNKLKIALLEAQQKGELTELEQRFSAIQTEAKSEDKWVRRARPTFMYIFYLILVCVVLVFPIIGAFQPQFMTSFYENIGLGFKAIPGELWGVFTAGYLGYGAYRSYEKVKGAAR